MRHLLIRSLKRPGAVGALALVGATGCSIHYHYSLLEASHLPASRNAGAAQSWWLLGALALAGGAVGAGLWWFVSRLPARRRAPVQSGTDAVLSHSPDVPPRVMPTSLPPASASHTPEPAGEIA